MAEVIFSHDEPQPQRAIVTFDKLWRDPTDDDWGKLVASPVDPIQKRPFYFALGLDTHRMVADLTSRLGPEPTPEEYWSSVVLVVYFQHGDLFAHSKSQQPRSLANWRRELDAVTEAVQAGPERRQALLKQQFSPAQVSPFAEGIVEGMPPPTRTLDATMIMKNGIQFHARNLLGWLWVLIARDEIEDVAYVLCEGCRWREVPIPSIPLPGRKFRQLKFCGVPCGNRHRQRVMRESAAKAEREQRW